MLSVFKDERIMFRIESMFHDSFVTAKGPYKFRIDTPNYDLDVYYNPNEQKFIFSESLEFTFTVSFKLLEDVCVFYLNDIYLDDPTEHTYIMLKEICSKVLSSFSLFNTSIRKNHNVVDFSVDFKRLCVFTNSFFENGFSRKNFFTFSDDNFFISFSFLPTNSFEVKFFSLNGKEKNFLFGLSEHGDYIEFSSQFLPENRLLIQDTDFMYFDLGVLYFCDYFLNLYYRYLMSNDMMIVVTNAKSKLRSLHNAKKVFLLDSNVFPNEFVFKEDAVNFSLENDIFINRNDSYRGLNNNSFIFKPFESVVDKVDKHIPFYVENFNEINSKTELQISSIPSDKLVNLSTDDYSSISYDFNSFSYENVKDLEFHHFLDVISKYSFMDKNINDTLLDFIKTYEFVSSRSKLISLMSKHFVFINVPEDFKEFIRVLFNSPSVSLFEEKFLFFLNNYHSKLKEVESYIEKQLSDELDVLLTFAEKRSSLLKDEFFLKNDIKNRGLSSTGE